MARPEVRSERDVPSGLVLERRLQRERGIELLFDADPFELFRHRLDSILRVGGARSPITTAMAAAKEIAALDDVVIGRASPGKVFSAGADDALGASAAAGRTIGAAGFGDATRSSIAFRSGS
jgi:hypothetical protein